MNVPSIHRCQPPSDDAGPVRGEIWYCPDCGRGWETTSRGDWTPAGRSPGGGSPSGPTSGFIAFPPAFERERERARLIESNKLAESLVGLDVREAVRLAAERGFDPTPPPECARLKWPHLEAAAQWGQMGLSFSATTLDTAWRPRRRPAAGSSTAAAAP